MQPVLLRALLSDPLAHGQGFLARCLVAEPATLAGTRLFRDGNPSEAPTVQRYYAALRTLFARKARPWSLAMASELEPSALVFTAQARALWIEFYDELEREQADGGELSGARAFASKAAEQAARIAGIVELIRDPNATEVSGESMVEQWRLPPFTWANTYGSPARRSPDDSSSICGHWPTG